MFRLTSILAFALALVGCSQRSTLTDNRFIVGFDPEFAPYGYRDGATYKGFDLDLAREVCAKYGWNFVACPIDWSKKDEELKAGRIDCIWSGFTIQGRETDYVWTEPYIDNSQMMLIRKNAKFRRIKELVNKRVAVQADTPIQRTLAKRFTCLVSMASYGEAVGELAKGTVDAVALDIGVAKKKMRESPGTFAMLGEVLQAETYGVGFRKGNEELRDRVEDALVELTDDGTVKILAGMYGIDEDTLTMWKK